MRDRREVYAVRDGGAWKFKVEEIERLVAERANDMLPEGADEFAELDDDPDSILVSDLGLTPSSSGASRTVIGKSNAPSSPTSDIHIAQPKSKSDESGSAPGSADGERRGQAGCRSCRWEAASRLILRPAA